MYLTELLGLKFACVCVRVLGFRVLEVSGLSSRVLGFFRVLGFGS